MNKGENIVFIGMPGCGKTTIGKIIADKMNYDFIDVDSLIEKKFGAIPKLFNRGEDYFRRCETVCAKEAAAMQNASIATGGGIVLKKENMSALSKTGTIIFLNRSVENILKDIACETRPLLAQGKGKLYDLYNQRIALYNKYADIKIDSNKSIEEVIDDILRKIKES